MAFATLTPMATAPTLIAFAVAVAELVAVELSEMAQVEFNVELPLT